MGFIDERKFNLIHQTSENLLILKSSIETESKPNYAG